MKKNINILYRATILFCLCLSIGLYTSCDSYEFDLPEAGSSLPNAGFIQVVNSRDFTLVQFTNTSSESLSYSWDFGSTGIICKNVPAVLDDDGEILTAAYVDCDDTLHTTTIKDPLVRFVNAQIDDEYSVTLTASDAKGNPDSITKDVLIELVPINPEVLNGDFSNGRDNWEMPAFTGGTITSFNTSSDGSPLLYDGTDSGSTKTAGAKWGNYSTSPRTSDNRYAYQAFEVSPNIKYILEYEYSIKNEDADNFVGGRRVVAEILDGHFNDGLQAVLSSEAGEYLVQNVGTVANGKGSFTLVKQEFTSNASGEIAIWLTSFTDVDTYIDNVKLYPKP